MALCVCEPSTSNPSPLAVEELFSSTDQDDFAFLEEPLLTVHRHVCFRVRIVPIVMAVLKPIRLIR